MNPWKGLGGLPRPVWVVFAATLVNRAGTMVLPFLVLYLTGSKGMTAATAGLALTAYGAGALITGPLAGRLCDRVGAARVAEASLLLSGVLVMLIPLASGYAAVLGLVFLWALTGEAFRPASMTVATEMTAPAQIKPAVAAVRLAVNLGMSVGPAAGGFLAMVSFPALFVVDGATSLLAGLVLAATRRGGETARMAKAVTQDPTPQGRAPSAGALAPLADQRLVWLLLALIPTLMVFFQFQAAMPLTMVRHLKMPESVYGLMLTINTLMVILIELPLSAATSRWPHRLTLPLGALLTGAGFGSMVFAGGYVVVAASVVIWTFGEMLLLPTAATYVAEIAPRQHRGQYMGLYTMAFSIAFVIGPWLGALVLERSGPAAVWGAAFAVGCLSAAMLAGVTRRASSERDAYASGGGG